MCLPAPRRSRPDPVDVPQPVPQRRGVGNIAGRASASIAQFAFDWAQVLADPYGELCLRCLSRGDGQHDLNDLGLGRVQLESVQVLVNSNPATIRWSSRKNVAGW